MLVLFFACFGYFISDKQVEPADMPNETVNPEHFMAVVRSHRGTIMGIAAAFYRPGSYCFDAMVCDLSTYLWQVLVSLPPEQDITNEEAWVYTVLYRKAHNLLRNESRYQRRLVYGADLSNVANDDTERLIDKMYYLVRRLDEEEQEMITLYLKHGNMMKMANAMGAGYIKVVRRLSAIVDKLARLNEALGDDFDIEAMADEAMDEEKQIDNNDKTSSDEEHSNIY